MKTEEVTIATITWARNAEDERLLRDSLCSLTALGAAVVVADGGSSDGFLEDLQRLPKTKAFRAERPGVVAQSQASLKAARTHGTKFLLYTEPDKRHFFDGVLREFIHATDADDTLGVSVASRTPKSFATFPPTQQCTEGTINSLFGYEVGLSADFCYGPLILNRSLIQELAALTDEVGWGWRFYLMAAAKHAGLQLRSYQAVLPCPPDQRVNDVAERMHRMRQLEQNLRGIMSFIESQANDPAACGPSSRTPPKGTT